MWCSLPSITAVREVPGNLEGEIAKTIFLQETDRSEIRQNYWDCKFLVVSAATEYVNSILRLCLLFLSGPRNDRDSYPADLR